MAAIDKETSKAQYEAIHGPRLLLEKSASDRESSSSAPAEDKHRPSKTFSHQVSDEVIRGGQIVGNWRQPLLEKIGGVTPNRDKRLV